MTPVHAISIADDSVYHALGEQSVTVSITEDDTAGVTIDPAVLTEHDAANRFRFQVEFSEGVGISYTTLRDDSFTVSDGDVTNAQRVDSRNDLWQITVEPDSQADVTITLYGSRTRGSTGPVCTRGDNPQPLTNSPSGSSGMSRSTLMRKTLAAVLIG